MPPNGGGPFQTVCLPDGRLGLLSWPRWDGPPDPGSIRNPATVAVADREGRVLEVLGSVPGFDQFAYGRSVGPRPFGRMTTLAALPHGMAVATGDAYVVDVVSQDGAVRDVYRRPLEAPALEDTTIRRYVDARERRRGARPGTPAQLFAGEFPDRQPAYGRILADDAGFLWVQDPGGADGTGADTWAVFSPEGVLLGTVAMPPGLHLLEIGIDHVVGVFTDPDEVESIRVHRLRGREPAAHAAGPRPDS